VRTAFPFHRDLRVPLSAFRGADANGDVYLGVHKGDLAGVPLRVALHLREPVNGLTHGTGALLALAVLVVALAMAVHTGKIAHVIGFGVFGLSLVALYTASALCHALPLSAIAVARLRLLDHALIFVLIAGTYTPVCLVALHGGWRWGLLSLIWGLAAGGIALKLRWTRMPGGLSTALYELMGLVAVIAVPALVRAVPLGGLVWLLVGGLAYSVGALVYARGRPTLIPGVLGPHELWHLFVLAGSACHVWALLRYVAPLG